MPGIAIVFFAIIFSIVTDSVDIPSGAGVSTFVGVFSPGFLGSRSFTPNFLRAAFENMSLPENTLLTMSSLIAIIVFYLPFVIQVSLFLLSNNSLRDQYKCFSPMATYFQVR